MLLLNLNSNIEIHKWKTFEFKLTDGVHLNSNIEIHKFWIDNKEVTVCFNLNSNIEIHKFKIKRLYDEAATFKF